MIEYNLISTGSTAVSHVFSNVLTAIFNENKYQKIKELANVAEELLKTKGYLDIPLLMRELSIDADTSYGVLNYLRDTGRIVPQNVI